MQEEKKDHIHLSECSKPKGEYAATAGYETIDTIKTCGKDGKDVCIFPVKNLKDGFNVCNTHPEKCKNFMYNRTANIITFINDTVKLSINSNMDIYTRQT